MTEADVRRDLRQWILNRAGAEDTADFDDQSPIIDDGLLTSLDVVELILFIEHLRGEEVDPDALEPESFASIDALMATFFDARYLKAS